MSEMKKADYVPLVVNKIRPLLAGLPTEVQSAILADLLATWLNGHHVLGDPQATLEIRGHLLADHFRLVSDLARGADEEAYE